MYAYPAGTSFCSCASSRAALHVGSLLLRNRQPSNAPPLLLSPTGRATRRGPQMQNTLGGTPRHPRSSGATSASIGQTLRYTAGSPPRCGASSSPHKVLRPCRDPKSPRAGARRANHLPSPLLKGGELWCGWANTLRSAASFLGKYISRTPTTAKLICFYHFLNLKTFCKILCEFNTFTANFPVFVRISGRCFSFFRFPFLRARGKTPNFSKGAKRAWKKSIFPR